jgi:hypothetical protein
MSDKNFILKEFQDTLARFKEDENKWENNTKAAYIKKCAELVSAQIEAKIIDIETEGISSYLYSQLKNYDIEVSERTIQRTLPDNYKRNYSKSDNVSELEVEKWEVVPTDDPTITLEKNQFNEIKYNGVEQRDREVKQHTPKDESTTTTKKDTRQMTYLKSCSKLANKYHLTFETLISRYNESDDIEMIMDKEIGNVETKLKEYAKAWANIENSKGMIDLRRDYGEYEKIMGTFMIETGETIARIAQLMDYSEKYGSIGLLREPKVRAFFEKEDTYPLYLRSCPSCLTDISKVMNHNIALYRECLDLTIDVPIIKYNNN